MRSLTFNRNLFDEMDQFLNHFASSQALPERAFSPAAEVTEDKEHFLMSFDLPGFKKEDIKIDLNENVLTISGERKRVVTENEKKWQRAERTYGAFSRSFQLPNTIASEKIEAQYEDGVLSLYIPKAPLAATKKIEIQTNRSGFFKRLESTQDQNTPSPH